MDILKIKTIIESETLTDEHKEHFILATLAKDESVISKLLVMLEIERSNKKELISDMNLELSRTHTYIELREENKKEAKENFNKVFVVGKVAEFYTKYKGIVSHCFNRFN